LVIKLSMFKIQLENGEIYKNKSSRVQHFNSDEKAKTKIDKLGDIASGAIVVECKARTTTTAKTKAVKVSKAKKAAAKAEKPAESATDEKVVSNKAKKAKKSKNQ